jgi:hypothetical protein
MRRHNWNVTRPIESAWHKVRKKNRKKKSITGEHTCMELGVLFFDTTVDTRFKTASNKLKAAAI